MNRETQSRARERAAELGISVAEYVRRLLARDLEGPTNPIHPSAIFDLGSSGGTDIARDKDELLGEAIAASLAEKQKT